MWPRYGRIHQSALHPGGVRASQIACHVCVYGAVRVDWNEAAVKLDRVAKGFDCYGEAAGMGNAPSRGIEIEVVCARRCRGCG